MPFSIDKSLVLYYGAHNPKRIYMLQERILQNSDTLQDLGVASSALGNCKQHLATLISNASRLFGALLRKFYY